MRLIQPIAKLKRQAEKQSDNLEGGRPWRMLDFFLYLLLIMLVVLSVRAVAIDPVRVDGSSMLDTLEENDIMFVDRIVYCFRAPKRGDIVICYYPDDYYEQTNKSYNTRVKRVIAVGGDTIEARDGVVLINGTAIDEPYLTLSRVGFLEIERQVIPDGCVYVLGDNRSVSIDSRNPSVGPIPLFRVIGKVRGVLYPFSRIGKP